MEKRKLGASGPEVPVIGFGCWTLGKGQFGFTDESEAITAVHRAIDLGVTLFDTAAVYGWGTSEELLGRALVGRRHRAVVATKGGRLWDLKTGERGNISSRAFLQKGLEESLRRLQTDYVDLFLIHWPDESRPMEEPMSVFAQWQREGKIRYGGVSNFSPAQVAECLVHFPIACNQVGYHLFDRRPESKILPFCREHGVGVMTYGSLAHGLLTGALTPETKFAPDDARAGGVLFGQPIFQGENYLRNLAIVEKLKAIAKRHNRTVAQLAVAWVLSDPAVTLALTGIRKPSEIEENIGAAGWKLTAKDRQEIEAAFKG
ncbi:MAG: aldo/keto reductase [Chloroflexota bacterium]|nr:aldo/keto reductase [Chloroflexota bacterium]